jgi:hypothetical protein
MLRDGDFAAASSELVQHKLTRLRAFGRFSIDVMVTSRNRENAMGTHHKERTAHAAEVLRRLDELGAVKVNVLVAKSAEIGGIVGASFDDDGYQICYPNYIHVGPRQDIDLVSVANQLRELGLEITRVNTAQTKA